MTSPRTELRRRRSTFPSPHSSSRRCAAGAPERLPDLTEEELGTGPIAGAFVPLWTITNELLLNLLESMQPEADEANTLAKATLIMRRVLRNRLQRRKS